MDLFHNKTDGKNIAKGNHAEPHPITSNIIGDVRSILTTLSGNLIDQGWPGQLNGECLLIVDGLAAPTTQPTASAMKTSVAWQTAGLVGGGNDATVRDKTTLLKSKEREHGIEAMQIRNWCHA